ncbi:guanylate-binding protein 2-like [Mercenaria mercenaria]|uniref:guanylate-binding protein 2-like n=1 Tax=Mercenaria mercenaria TaxID=6596 RepID=UPI00234F21E8|nr:guanylate-binding protein 2-like [Mercenaria mercenaria]
MTEPAGPRKLTDSRYSVFSKPAQTSTKQPISPIFDTPMRLVVNTDGKTTLNHETLAELSKIEKTLNVVSVVGSLRTGKSFLLNKLANTEAEEKTAGVFLEGKLVLQRGLTDDIRKFNEPRQLIRRYFKKRRCFIFRKSAKQKLISQLMKIPDSDLKPESRRAINGRMLATLLTSYVNSIQDGKLPCLSEAMATMADVENACAVEKATEVYNTEMKKRIAAHNTPTDTGLVNFHRDSMKAAIEVLKTGLVFDDEQVYEEQSLVKFKELLRKFKSAADKNSRAICLNRLEILNLEMVKKMNNRVYCHPAGYDEYIKDINRLIKQYNNDAPYLGTKARAALQEFLDSKESEEEKVYQMVLHAQEGTQEKSRPRIQRLRSLTEEDPQTLAENEKKKATEEEKIEKEIKRDITILQIDGMKSIGSQYLEMLEIKIKELERVKDELSSDDPYYESLRLETEHWKNLLEKATWNMPQYKNKLQPITESSSQVKHLATSQVSESSEKLDEKQDNEGSKQKERATGDGGDARPKYDENYFRVKPNPAPTNPESIDSKFIIDLERREKEKDKTECLIL